MLFRFGIWLRCTRLAGNPLLFRRLWRPIDICGSNAVIGVGHCLMPNAPAVAGSRSYKVEATFNTLSWSALGATQQAFVCRCGLYGMESAVADARARLPCACGGPCSRSSGVEQRPSAKTRRWIAEVTHSRLNRFRTLLLPFGKLYRSSLALNRLAAAVNVFSKIKLNVNVIYG
jgi:hypothetical protein